MARSMPTPWILSTLTSLISPDRTNEKPHQFSSKIVQAISYFEALNLFIISDTMNSISVFMTEKCAKDFKESFCGSVNNCLINLEQYHFSTTVQNCSNRSVTDITQKGVSVPFAIQCNKLSFLGNNDITVINDCNDANRDPDLRAMIHNMRYCDLTKRLVASQFPNEQCLPDADGNFVQQVQMSEDQSDLLKEAIISSDQQALLDMMDSNYDHSYAVNFYRGRVDGIENASERPTKRAKKDMEHTQTQTQTSDNNMENTHSASIQPARSAIDAMTNTQVDSMSVEQTLVDFGKSQDSQMTLTASQTETVVSTNTMASSKQIDSSAIMNSAVENRPNMANVEQSTQMSNDTSNKLSATDTLASSANTQEASEVSLSSNGVLDSFGADHSQILKSIMKVTESVKDHETQGTASTTPTAATRNKQNKKKKATTAATTKKLESIAELSNELSQQTEPKMSQDLVLGAMTMDEGNRHNNSMNNLTGSLDLGTQFITQAFPPSQQSQSIESLDESNNSYNHINPYQSSFAYTQNQFSQISQLTSSLNSQGVMGYANYPHSQWMPSSTLGLDSNSMTMTNMSLGGQSNMPNASQINHISNNGVSQVYPSPARSVNSQNQGQMSEMKVMLSLINSNNDTSASQQYMLDKSSKVRIEDMLLDNGYITAILIAQYNDHILDKISLALADNKTNSDNESNATANDFHSIYKCVVSANESRLSKNVLHILTDMILERGLEWVQLWALTTLHRIVSYRVDNHITKRPSSEYKRSFISPHITDYTLSKRIRKPLKSFSETFSPHEMRRLDHVHIASAAPMISTLVRKQDDRNRWVYGCGISYNEGENRYIVRYENGLLESLSDIEFCRLMILNDNKVVINSSLVAVGNDVPLREGINERQSLSSSVSNEPAKVTAQATMTNRSSISTPSAMVNNHGNSGVGGNSSAMNGSASNHNQSLSGVAAPANSSSSRSSRIIRQALFDLFHGHRVITGFDEDAKVPTYIKNPYHKDAM